MPHRYLLTAALLIRIPLMAVSIPCPDSYVRGLRAQFLAATSRRDAYTLMLLLRLQLLGGIEEKKYVSSSIDATVQLNVNTPANSTSAPRANKSEEEF